MPQTIGQTTPPTSLEVKKTNVVNRLISGLALALVPISGFITYYALRDGWSLMSILQLLGFAIIILLALRKNLLSANQRALISTTILFFTLLLNVYNSGLFTPTFPMLAILPVLITVVGGFRSGLIAMITVLVSLATVAWLNLTLGEIPFEYPKVSGVGATDWLLHILNLLIASAVGVYVIGSLHRILYKSNAELAVQNSSLADSRAREAHANKLAGLGHSMADQHTGKVLECDARYAEMHGMTSDQFMQVDIRGGISHQLLDPDERAEAIKTHQRLLNGETAITELGYTLANDEIRYIRKIFTPVDQNNPTNGLYNVVAQDVTEARNLHEQLFQASKMDAIGKLTGGVAHDFNNILAVALGNLELLEDEITDPDQAKLNQAAMDAIMRGSELTRHMLSFARQAPLQPTTVDLNQLVHNMKNWIGRTIPSTIAVETSMLAGLWPIKADASSTENALLNLILNARDAMPFGGHLTIETTNMRIDDDYLETRKEDIPPGRYVLLAVSDTGEGIPANNLPNIFEPFFTTKPVGSGSGLGLSMLQGFMKQSGGAVRVYSELNIGTTFKLYFPVAPESSAAIMPKITNAPLPNSGTSKVILLAEDNEDVLIAVQELLVRAGYHVRSAPSGDAALIAYQDDPNIDLLVTDIVMPGKLQGTDLARSLRKIRPDLPVVFMSGYAAEATVHGNGLRPEDSRLMKPVQRADLLRAVNKALKQSSD